MMDEGTGTVTGVSIDLIEKLSIPTVSATSTQKGSPAASPGCFLSVTYSPTRCTRSRSD